MYSNRCDYIWQQTYRLLVKYKEPSFLVYLKIVFYTVKALFVGLLPKIPPKDNNIYIGFIIEGGLGDFLININYIYCFLEKIYKENIIVDIITNSKIFAESLIPELYGLRNVIVNKGLKTNNYYDVKIRLFRRPYIIFINKSRIQKFAPHIIPFVNAYEHKKEQFFLLFQNSPYFEGVADIIDMADNKNRLLQADINNLLNMTQEFKVKFPIKNAEETLTKFNLNNKTYITVAREVGYDKVVNSTKLWPLKNYRELTKQIKQTFPHITIVEIGAGKGERISQNIDINLAGKTTLEEAKAVIKNSLLHIDTEGGLSYLRYALKAGPSIILMGSTNPKVYGLKGNINIHTKKCPIYCAELLNTWQEECHKLKDKNICMQSISVETVFAEVNKFLTSHIDSKNN